jgi:hypothetical protein
MGIIFKSNIWLILDIRQDKITQLITLSPLELSQIMEILLKDIKFNTQVMNNV